MGTHGSLSRLMGRRRRLENPDVQEMERQKRKRYQDKIKSDVDRRERQNERDRLIRSKKKKVPDYLKKFSKADGVHD
jgi:hypothetical protein